LSIYWKVFTDAGSKDKAMKVAKSVVKSIDISYSELLVEPYHKGGFTCSFETPVSKGDWSLVLLQTIELAQKVGRSYIITGSIQNELDLWSNESNISGVTNIQIVVVKSA